MTAFDEASAGFVTADSLSFVSVSPCDLPTCPGEKVVIEELCRPGTRRCPGEQARGGCDDALNVADFSPAAGRFVGSGDDDGEGNGDIALGGLRHGNGWSGSGRASLLAGDASSLSHVALVCSTCARMPVSQPGSALSPTCRRHGGVADSSSAADGAGTASARALDGDSQAVATLPAAGAAATGEAAALQGGAGDLGSGAPGIRAPGGGGLGPCGS